MDMDMDNDTVWNEENPLFLPCQKENKYPPVTFEYNEDQFLDTAKSYIASTYTQHYVGNKDATQEKPIQVIDLLISTGHAESFFLANAIKYLARYGKKDGKSKKDLLKTIHYVCLLLNLNHKEDTK
jgi:K+-transporting ATPase A subunit